MLGLRLYSNSNWGCNALPLGLEETSKVTKRQLARGVLQSSKMEHNVSLHGSEQGEAGLLSGSVHEIRLGNSTILASGKRLANNTLNHVHLANDVVKGHDVGKGDLVSRIDVAERRQVVENVIRKFMSSNVDHDPLELVGGDVAADLGIIEFKGLAEALCLETLQELSKLFVGHLVCGILSSSIQSEPFALKVKRNGILANVGREDLHELLSCNLA